MKYISVIAVTISIIILQFLSSCAPADNTEKRAEFTKIIANKDCSELLSDLYIASDGDDESLARILNVTPSVIKRIRNKETQASYEFEEIIREVSVFYYLNSKNFYRLRSNLDPKWKPIIDTIGHLPKYNPILFWLILLLMIAGMIYCLVVWYYHSWRYFGVAIVVYLLIWLLSLLFAPKPMHDSYVETINPIVEKII